MLKFATKETFMAWAHKRGLTYVKQVCWATPKSILPDDDKTSPNSLVTQLNLYTDPKGTVYITIGDGNSFLIMKQIKI